MSTMIESLQSQIKALPHDEFMHLRAWLTEQEWERWDAQIAADSDAGKLDFLIEEAQSIQYASKPTLYELHEHAVDTGIGDFAENLDHYLYGVDKQDG